MLGRRGGAQHRKRREGGARAPPVAPRIRRRLYSLRAGGKWAVLFRKASDAVFPRRVASASGQAG
ncbi:hypothetical protein WN55_05159 [Dufourea novaeangliae]|uniref:Uncharacterized protein n=1 Tax=Dufourea novaeangliae TaxID=178035 RepID=A0A154PPD9_DUFNO|nr:hypothetical protein WN55_05159 [Dufourea novaeangliae]